MSQASTDSSVGQTVQQAPMTPPTQRAMTSPQQTPPQKVKKHRSVDMYLAILQGAPAMVKIGPVVDDKPTQTYFLPKHLLACHSTFFRNEFNKGPKDDGITQIDLPNVEPIPFGFFIYFIYRGNYGTNVDRDACKAGDLIPPSVKAYVMAEKFGANSFQDHIMLHIFNDIGKIFSITPQLMEYVETNMPPTSKLRAFFVDAWICYWGKRECIVKNDGKETDEEWNRFLDAFPDTRKEFIFGLKGKVKIERYEHYCVGWYEQVLPAAAVIKEEDQ